MDYDELRKQMISRDLRESGAVADETVLEAMSKVPRHLFVPQHLRHVAYAERALPIGQRQTITEPLIVAVMMELLQVGPGHKVLEIGTGSGYESAILAEIGAEVYSMERVPELAARAHALLKELGYAKVQVVLGDGSVGCPDAAPFDRIIAGAAGPEVPQPLLGQLAPGGRMVVPVGSRDSQDLVVLEEAGGQITRRAVMGCSFGPLIGECGWDEPRGK